MKKMTAVVFVLSGCSAPVQPSILGFDGSVVEVGISNQDQQFVSTQKDRVAGTQQRATTFCKSKGYDRAEFQQEIMKDTYALGPRFSHIAYLCT